MGLYYRSLLVFPIPKWRALVTLCKSWLWKPITIYSSGGIPLKIYSLRALYLLTPDELEWISPYILCYITLHLLPTYCILYRRAPFKRRAKSLGACTQGMDGWKFTLGWSWLGLAVGIARRPNKGLAGRLRITEFSQSGLFLTRVINKRNTVLFLLNYDLQ